MQKPRSLLIHANQTIIHEAWSTNCEVEVLRTLLDNNFVLELKHHFVSLYIIMDVLTISNV